MSAHVLPAASSPHHPVWWRRLGLSLLLLLGATVAYLPYAFYPLISPNARPVLWGGTALGLLALALLARRNVRFRAY